MKRGAMRDLERFLVGVAVGAGIGWVALTFAASHAAADRAVEASAATRRAECRALVEDVRRVLDRVDGVAPADTATTAG